MKSERLVLVVRLREHLSNIVANSPFTIHTASVTMNRVKNMETQVRGSKQPFLTRYAVTRQPHPPIGGRYCSERDIWVEETGAGSRPIVSGNPALAGMVTKTLQEQEQDDDHFIGIPELATKTDVQQESDDQISCISLMELVTKTSQQLESDDQGAQLL